MPDAERPFDFISAVYPIGKGLQPSFCFYHFNFFAVKNRDSRRIVPTVFQLAKTVQQNRRRLFLPNISNYCLLYTSCCYFCRHQVQNGNLQRADVLRQRPCFRDNKNILIVEYLSSRQLIWYFNPVSYTHLDVYKRQVYSAPGRGNHYR